MKIANTPATPQTNRAIQHHWADLDGDKRIEYPQDGVILSAQQEEKPKLTLREAAEHFFLPNNYQVSVSKDYLPTRAWGFAHGIMASCAHYCSTAAIVGSVAGGAVGPLTVGLVWTVRGTISRIGQISGSLLADRADKNPRLWMKTGTAIDVASTVAESTLAAFPHAYLAVAIPTGIIRAFGGVMAGAAGTPIGQRQAIANNLGEMAVKDGNQNMVASAIGGTLGFVAERLLHPYCGPLAGSAVALVAAGTQAWLYGRWLNALEYRPVNQDVVRTMVEKGSAPDPSEVSDIKGFRRLFTRDPIVVGKPLRPLAENPARLEQLVELFGQRNYLIEADPKGGSYIVMHDGATKGDCLLAVCQAAKIEQLVESPECKALPESARPDWLLKKSLESTPTDSEPLLKDLGTQGWSTDLLRLNDAGKRAVWHQEKL